MDIIIYDIETGRIKRNVTVPPHMVEFQAQPGEAHIEGSADFDAFYVVDGLVAPRNTMAPVLTGMTISNLPIPCTLWVYGQSYDIVDGEVELSFDLPGQYKVKVSSFPYLDWEVTVEQT